MILITMKHRRLAASSKAREGAAVRASTESVVPILLASFFAMYAGIHAYAYAKVRMAFEPGAGAGFAVGAWLILMTFAPFIGWYLQRHGWRVAGAATTHVAYNWMGFMFLFSCTEAAFALYRLATHATASALHGGANVFMPTDRQAFLTAVALSAGAAVYGHIEARLVRVTRVRLRTAKLPPSIGRLRIVQLADMHLGVLVGARRLHRILARVQALQPDIVVSTGDLVDREAVRLNELARFFRKIDPPYGKFAVVGNHEFLAGLDRALDFTERAGFTLLRGRAVTIAGAVALAGVDDPTGKWMGVPVHADEKTVLSALPRRRFTVLLKHQPLVARDGVGRFDLQLSGHTHGGQIFPFGLLTRLLYRVRAGLTPLSPRGYLYVSRGTGTSGPPMRVLAPPEIALIEIETSKAGAR